MSVRSSLTGNADIAVGNVVGSNIFNVLFILGCSAAIVPLTVASQLIRRDVPLMILASMLVALLGADGTINRWDGSLLFTGIVAYTVWCVRQSRSESREVQLQFAEGLPAPPSGQASRWFELGFIVVGLILLAIGSRLLIDGATTVAQRLGVSQLIIGLTIVAAGTSLPEVVTSIVAAVRGERDIAVGNVVGSNLFNVLCVLGMSGIVATDGVTVAPTALRFDIPVMIAVAVACLPMFVTGNEISRWEGVLFLFYYVMYTLYLVLDATASEFQRTFAGVLVAFVMPLTAITLIITWIRALRTNPARDGW